MIVKKTLFGLLSLATALIGAGIWWRWASRRRQLPCPSWLAGVLDNPLTETVAGTQTTLDRIGLQPGEVVLDVGSGPGRLAVPAAQRVGANGRVVALDVQPEMLARLQERAAEAGVTNIELQLVDISGDNSLPANRFDRAWLVTVLGEIPDREAALRNLWRLLRPGGTLSITEIFPDPHYQTRSTVLKLGQASGFDPTHYWGTPLAFTQNFVKRGN
jgi:SAM-dependent methyltransferase